MRFILTSYLAKIISITAKVFKFGSGYTWAGHIALKVYPNVLSSSKLQFPKGIILVSGTNGKTTTSKLIAHLLTTSGLKVLSNTTGANLLNGLVSHSLLSLNWFGKHKYDVAVFEVDEFTLPSVLTYLSPKVLVLLNLSRDQLDRYGETDIIFEKWLHAIEKISVSTQILMSIEQPEFKEIPKMYAGPVFYFDDDKTLLKTTKLKGSFNAKNINASVLASQLLGVSNDTLHNSLSSFESAYGRGEVIFYSSQAFHMFLAKNPASFNNNLELLSEYASENTAVFLILNDNIPDGRDVSWIYDVDAGQLNSTLKSFSNIFIAGTRYLDMAVRLRYAGVDVKESNIDADPSKVLGHVQKMSGISEVLVFPNYSAMLEMRKLLTGRKIL